MAKRKITIEDLALMTKKGFDEMGRKFDRVLDKGTFKKFAEQNQKEHEEMKQDIEEIKLRLGNVAFRFEVIELDRRLKKVEAKLGIMEDSQ